MSADTSAPLHSTSLITRSSELIAQLCAGSVFVVALIGSASCFTLPVLYSTRAAAYYGGPAQWIAFLSQLIIEGKAFIAGSVFCVSIDLAILQSHYVVEFTILRIAGYIAVAFSVVSFASSSALVVVASARRMGIQTQHRVYDADSPAMTTGGATTTDIEMGSHSVHLDFDDPHPILFGSPTFVAFPAICMSWCTIFSVLCMLLFVWCANKSF